MSVKQDDDAADTPVKVLDDRAGGRDAGPPRWLMLAVGAALGAAAVVMLSGGIEPNVTAASTSLPSVATTEPNVVETTIPRAPPSDAESEPAFRLPRDVITGRLAAITGSWNAYALEVWRPGQLPATTPLPAGAGSSLDVDASGLFYAFTGRSADPAVSVLLVGRGTDHAPLGAMVSGHSWHRTNPWTIAWIDSTGHDPVIRVAALSFDAGSVQTSLDGRDTMVKVAPARPGESLVTYDDQGFVLFRPGDRVEYPDRVEYEPNLLRRIGLDGAAIAEIEADPLAFAASGHGLVSTWDEKNDQRVVIVDERLTEVADLGSREPGAHVASAAWSPDGAAVATIAGSVDSSGTIRGWLLTTHTAEGFSLRYVPLNLPLYAQLWNLTWSRDGTQIVMLSRDSANRTSMLLVDAISGGITAIPVPDRVASIALLD